MWIDRIRRVTRDGRWIPEIDGLRFIAIFSVLMFHLAGEVKMRSGHVLAIEPRYHALFNAIGNGDRGVRLFFIISGMILAMPFARFYLAHGREVSLRKYYLRRVTRLEPPYLLSMLLFTALVAVYSRGHLEPHYGLHALASLFYLHGLIYHQLSPVNPVTWSLEVEIQFYLLAPLVMHLFRIPGRGPRRLLMAAIIVLLGLLQAPFGASMFFIGTILYYLQYFLAGLLLADLFVLELPHLRPGWIWDVAGFSALGLMFAPLWRPHLILPFILGLLCLSSMRSLVLRRLVSQPLIAVVGGMCYSIYLAHFALMAVFFKVTRHLLSARLDFLANYLIQSLLLAVPIILCSGVFYLLVERPCMDPDWPSKLWHRLGGRGGTELDAGGISDRDTQAQNITPLQNAGKLDSSA